MTHPPSLIDISVQLNPSVPVWPGRPRVRVETDVDQVDDLQIRNSVLTMDVHSGTHVDAPKHFVSDGLGVDDLPLTSLIGRAYIVHAPTDVKVVTEEVLESLAIPHEVERLLIGTPNSELWGNPDFQSTYVGLDLGAARWIVDRGIVAVGIDYLSIQGFAESPMTHQVLLESGVTVIEGLYLREVDPGWYTLVCLPLLLEGAEGAPARAILVSNPDWIPGG